MAFETDGIFVFEEFELDSFKRCLTRNGHPVAIPPKAFEVLAYLVRNAGNVMAKEDLLNSIWKDAFVEEGNLVQQIRSLRKALGDRADLIVTVPGRGYQFTARVKKMEYAGAASGSANGANVVVQQVREHTHMVVEESIPVADQPSRTEETRAAPWFSTRPAKWGAVIVVVLSLIAGGIVYSRHDSVRYHGHVIAVLANLDNETGDSEFDHALNRVLKIDLQQSPYFTVIGDSSINQTLKMMQQDPNAALTAPLAREVCQRLNGQVYLVPAISRVGSHYSLSIQVSGCADGKTLGASAKEVSSKDDILSAWEELTRSSRRLAGESRNSLQEYDHPFIRASTSSLDALRAYSEAIRLGNSGKYQQAIALYKHAIELDPDFAVAYLDMSSYYYNLGDSVHDKEAVTKAYELRDHANERERLIIEARYAQSDTGDLHALLDVLHQWAGVYPNDNLPLGMLVNFETWTGHYPEAAAHADRLGEVERQMGIHNGISLEIRARAYYHANLPDKLRATYAKAMEEKNDTQGLHGILLEFAAINGDQGEIDRQIAWSRNTPAETHMLQMAGCVAMTQGQAKKADALFAEAGRTAARDNMLDSLVDLDDYHIRLLVDAGLKDRARELLKTLPAGEPSADRAFAMAGLGQIEPALAVVKKMRALNPQDTLVNVEYAPSVEAVIAVAQNRPSEAIHLLEPALQYELRDPTVPYLRGQVYLAARQPKEALAEFAKLAGHPWIADPLAPLIPLAHLGLARAYAQQNDAANARQEYGKFFDAWKNADSDLPVLVTARREYALLR